MATVSIRAYTRRSRKGKPIKVKRYARRVGRKGFHQVKPSRETSGGELQKVIQEKTISKDRPMLTPEELAERREIAKGFKRAEAERVSLGMTKEQYSRYALQRYKKQEAAKKTKQITKPTTAPKKESGSLSKLDTKVLNFIEKYSGYKGKMPFKR